jgi:capsular polysaccharide biosynthesis protein
MSFRFLDILIKTPHKYDGTFSFRSKSQYDWHIKTGGTQASVGMQRYVIEVKNVLYAPRSYGVLISRDRTVLLPYPLDIDVNTANSFGHHSQLLPNGNIRVHYEEPSRVIDGPVICAHFSRGHGVFNIGTMTSLHRARSIVGHDVPILVPDDLSRRQWSYLALVGINPVDCIAVPRFTPVGVRRAFVPSRSFVRDLRIREGKSMRPIGMLFEPVDIRAINAIVRARFAAAPPRRVYISRQDAVERQTPNEAEVMRSLSLSGFERVMIGQMPVKESIEILASASTVVVPHGSGGANLLFAPPGSSVVEIDDIRQDWAIHGTALALDQRYRLIGRVPAEKRARGGNEKFGHAVNVAELETAVEWATSAEAKRT